MNKPKFRAWDEYHEKLVEVASIDFDNGICLVRDVEGDVYSVHRDNLALMQYVGMHDEENLTDIWEQDLLEIESPKGKFIAKVESCYGTWGITAIKGEVVDYFEDHWCDSFMPLIDLYWNENGDDGCLPKSRRLGSIHANPELLNEVE